MIKQDRLAAITLLFISPILTELLCSNMPASIFFQPHIFLSLMIVYGLPALLIRELSIRWDLGVFGIFVMGLAYGIYNEGICAKTLLMNNHVPVPTFDGYAVWTVNWAWGVLILVWHALHAILYPVVLVSCLFPSVKSRQWLHGRQMAWAVSLILISGSIMFFTTPRIKVAFLYLPLFLGAIIALVFLARYIPQGPQIKFSSSKMSWKLVFAGFIFYAMYLAGLSILGKMHATFWILLIYALAVLVLFYQWLKKTTAFTLPALTIFVLGDYTGVGFFPIVQALKRGAPEIWATNILLLFMLIISAFVIMRGSLRKRCASESL